MIFDVIHLIYKFAAVGLRHSGKPTLIPGADGIGKRLVPLLPNVLGDIQSPVDSHYRALGIALPCPGLGRLQGCVDASEIEEHGDVLPVELGNSDVEYQVVMVELDLLEIAVQKVQ